MNGNNPTDRLIKEQITAARTASGRVLKISLLAKMAGERRKCSSLWPGNGGTAKDLARSQQCSHCSPCVELACPHLRAEYCQHHAVTATQTSCPCWKGARREEVLWLHRETRRGDEELPWTTPWHLQKDGTQLLNGWSKSTKHIKYKYTSKSYLGISLPTSAVILWKQYQKLIWSSSIWGTRSGDGKTASLTRWHRNKAMSSAESTCSRFVFWWHLSITCFCPQKGLPKDYPQISVGSDVFCSASQQQKQMPTLWRLPRNFPITLFSRTLQVPLSLLCHPKGCWCSHSSSHTVVPSLSLLSLSCWLPSWSITL